MKKTLMTAALMLLSVTMARAYGLPEYLAPKGGELSAEARMNAAQPAEEAIRLNAPQSQPASMTAAAALTQGKAQSSFEWRVPRNETRSTRYFLPAPKATTIADLAGQYVMTYKSLTSTVGNGGTSSYITALGADSIVIHNFWSATVDVHAQVDLATGALTIPAQYLYNHDTYGAMWIAVCGTDGKPNYTAKITGQINADGSLSFDSWWGIFVKSGTSAGSFMIAAYDAKVQRANAIMSCDMFNAQPVSYNVIVTQDYDNQISVLNFGNFGMEVLIDLNRYSSGVIHSQVVRNFPQNADFLSCSVGGYAVTETGGVSLQAPLANDIYLDTLANVKQTNTLTWGCWTALSRGTTASYYLGAQLTGKIQTQTPINFPVLNITEFTGAGTQADPYQIKTREDLILLSQKTEDCTDANPNLPSNRVPQHQAFKGKYFKMMNDIDMSGTNFTAIGNTYYQRFAGTFDGNGHTISNLSVNAQGPYAALFGNCDTTAVLKNINLTKADISTTDNYAGTLAAWNYGTTDNCHATFSTVVGNGQCVGGLVGSASGGMTNCSVSNLQVAGAGGWCGGLVGQVQVKLEDCYATNMTVLAYPGSGTAAGGLAGMILCPAKNLYFSGTMDGYRLGAPESQGIITGSVVGTLTGGSLTNAFGVGTVLGRNSYCEVGGLAGRVQNSTVDNCYFRGRIGSYYSRMTGGLVGHVFALTNDGRPVPSYLSNLYCATTEDLEDYQYNRETGWAETLGKVEEGAIGKAENIYYDSQLFSRKSVNGSPLTTAQLTSGQLPAGFEASVWSATAGQYPTLKQFQTTAAAQWASSAVLLNDGASINKVNKNVKLTKVGATNYSFYRQGQLTNDGYSAKIEADSLIVTDFGIDTLVCANGVNSYYYIIKCAPVPFLGSGTADDPYQISTKQDLIDLGNFANVTKQYFPGSYFLQMNDIDMELDTAFHGIATVGSDAHCKFAGIYDGGGHFIHQMIVGGLNPVEPNVRPSGVGYTGFIGRLAEDGVLRNISFSADCDASKTWASTGVAVGVNTGLIENVRNYADITAMSCWVGGICGMNDKPGIIRNCYNAGNVVSGYNSAGGISGRNNGGIENCANAGNVEIKSLHSLWTNAKNVAGGITTSMSGAYVRNCLNVGYVYAEGPAAGGIVGSYNKLGTVADPVGNNDVLYCVSYGAVKCGEIATGGAVAGMTTTSVKVASPTRVLAYYDDQISSYGAYANAAFDGMYGLTTAQLTSGQPLDSLSTEYWQFDAGMYPTLKSFVNEPKLQAARKMLFTLPAGVTVRDMTADATLSGASSWSVSPATYFSVQGNTLKTGAVPAEKQTATVTGTILDFTKIIDIARIPPVPLTGQGTQASPYVINNVADWNNLADYINATNDQFEGKYLKLSADIDFTGATFKALFENDADLLNGTLDGDGHSVNFGNGLYIPGGNLHGPIRTIGENGTLQNFTFLGTIASGKANCGAVTGRVYGTLRNITSQVNYTLSGSLSGASAFGTAYPGAQIIGCVNKGDITSGGTYLAGLFSDAQTGVTFTDCSNQGKLTSMFNGTAPSSAQGIGGMIGGATSVKMTRCFNSGTFFFVNKPVMYGVGGLIGYAKSTTANTDSTVLVNCYNTAAIEAGFMIGGLIANIDGSTTIPNPIHLRDCYNSGDLISLGTASKTNGAIGGLLTMYTLGTEILGCYNTGTIMNNNTKQAYAAGIVAYYKAAPTAAAPMLIANCRNEADIFNAYNYSGGICAYVNNYVTINDCHNTAAIGAVIGAGGIAGNFGSASAQINRCWNSGEISCSDSRAGGIAGQATTVATITDCFNVGNITNTSETVTANATTKQATKGYGTGGIVGEGGGHMTRCYNAGTIKGIANVGGLIGRPSKNNTVVDYCYNAGEIQAPADTCGSLIGIDFSTAGRLWDASKNGVTNSYYLKVDTLVNNVAGTALSQPELCSLNLGNGWTSGIAYTYPMLTALCNDAAKVYAAQVVPNAVHFNNGVITGSFFVGVPENLSWSVNIPDHLTLDGNKFLWTPAAYQGKVILTATSGSFSRVIELNANKSSGIDTLGNEANVVEETWYNVAGIQVARPAVADGLIYIVVRRYENGTSKSFRIKN